MRENLHMKKSITSKTGIITVIILLILIAIAIILFPTVNNKDHHDDNQPLFEGLSFIEKKYHFSNPEILEKQQQTFISVKEADLNSIHDQWPVLPVNITTLNFPLGTKIHDVQISYPRIENISIPHPVSYGSCSTVTAESEEIYTTDEMYPKSHVSYHLGVAYQIRNIPRF